MIYSALVLGLLGSLHCMGMCGPIAFMLPVNRSNSWAKAGQIGLYHLGSKPRPAAGGSEGDAVGMDKAAADDDSLAGEEGDTGESMRYWPEPMN